MHELMKELLTPFNLLLYAQQKEMLRFWFIAIFRQYGKYYDVFFDSAIIHSM